MVLSIHWESCPDEGLMESLVCGDLGADNNLPPVVHLARAVCSQGISSTFVFNILLSLYGML